MKKISNLVVCAMVAMVLVSCQGNQQPESQQAAATANVPDGGQSTVQDDVSQKDVVKVAAASADHTTLVTAVKAAKPAQSAPRRDAGCRMA